MTPSELKRHVEAGTTDIFFFTRGSMAFFGDRMSNYGVRSTVITTYTDEALPVWELYRKRPVKHGLQASAYFCKETYRRVFEKE
jgi:hypothetical protein